MAKIIQGETMRLSKQYMNERRHAANCSTHSMTAAITFKLFYWLHATTLAPETRTKIEDLPFQSDLFSFKTDEMLKQNQEKTNTLLECLW